MCIRDSFPVADVSMELGEGEEEGDEDDGEDEDADFGDDFDGVELEEDVAGFPRDMMQSVEGEGGKGKRKRQVGTPARMSPSSSKTLARLRSEMESRPMSLGGRMSPANKASSTVDLPSLQLA